MWLKSRLFPFNHYLLIIPLTVATPFLIPYLHALNVCLLQAPNAVHNRGWLAYSWYPGHGAWSQSSQWSVICPDWLTSPQVYLINLAAMFTLDRIPTSAPSLCSKVSIHPSLGLWEHCYHILHQSYPSQPSRYIVVQQFSQLGWPPRCPGPLSVEWFSFHLWYYYVCL